MIREETPQVPMAPDPVSCRRGRLSRGGRGCGWSGARPGWMKISGKQEARCGSHHFLLSFPRSPASYSRFEHDLHRLMSPISPLFYLILIFQFHSLLLIADHRHFRHHFEDDLSIFSPIWLAARIRTHRQSVSKSH